jgi:hypothetical protein
MAKRDETVSRAVAEANEIFGRMRELVEERVRGGSTEIPVTEVATAAGLEIDERILSELQIPELVPVHGFLPWHLWWPWRPLWCWWWRIHYPWYGYCCPWWWWRCHWYPIY